MEFFCNRIIDTIDFIVNSTDVWCVCVCLMSQGLGGSWRDPGQGLQAAASAGQQQGEARHRSGRQTEARRHQSGLIKHVSRQ